MLYLKGIKGTVDVISKHPSFKKNVMSDSQQYSLKSLNLYLCEIEKNILKIIKFAQYPSYFLQHESACQ